MSVNLLPQDQLTLDLLAEVLAKMYRQSLNDMVNNLQVKPALDDPGSEPEQGQKHREPRPDIVQAKIQ
jgi:hypothetical protein